MCFLILKLKIIELEQWYENQFLNLGINIIFIRNMRKIKIFTCRIEKLL